MKYNNINYLPEILTQSNQIIVKQDDQDKRKQMMQTQVVRQENIQKLKKFQYEFIEESRMREDMFCRAFAFNKDNTILIIGCGSMTRIYQFINGKIGKELQILQNHKDDVYCLYFMRQSNCFVSGSLDNSIMIWKQDNNNQWVLLFKLTDHKGSVNCLLMNKNDDLLISGSQDETVKFWKIDDDKWSCKQTLQTSDYVFAMSLNEMEIKLITCNFDAFLHIMEIQDDNQWSLKQKIKVNKFGSRLCFTLGNQFVFQPQTKDFIIIFNFDNNSDEFKKLQQMQIKSSEDCNFYFPCQFVKPLNILIVQHGEFLNIFRINEDKNYELVQTIDYQNSFLFGTISNNGQHLITWDGGSKEIQVRKLMID